MKKQKNISFLLRKIFLFVLLSVAIPLIGQISSRENKKLFLDADNSFEVADYLSAKRVYDKLYQIDSNNNELNYKLGVCNYILKKYRKNAKSNFKRITSNDFPEANYYLGLLCHSEKEYEKAITYFNQYKNSAGELDHTLKEVNDLIAKCYTAKLFETQTNENIVIENLGSSVNTEYPEYAPLIPADEKFIIFTSRRKNILYTQTDAMGDYYEDIYLSKRTESGWQKPEFLDTTLNTATHDAGTGLSANGEKLLIYRTSKDMISGDIYESNLINGKWSSPAILEKNVNADGYSETSACYSADGETIFFSSDRLGGYGGKDLYLVKKLDNGKWGVPFNLGPTINTEYNEDAPFVAPSSNTLYFSSQGHKNMGGYDVFKSNYDEKAVFTEPENMGAPVNTVGDDIFFVINANGSTAYMSSEREGGFGSQDLYKVRFTDNASLFNAYTLYVEDNEKNRIKDAEIVLTNMEKREVYGVYKSSLLTGKLMIIAKPQQVFRMAIQAKGFEPRILDSFMFDKENEIVFKLNKSSQ